MPLTRFLALNSKIKEIDDDIHLKWLLTIFYANNPGKNGGALSKYIDELSGKHVNQKKTITPGITPGVSVMSNPDKIREEREKKIREWQEKARKYREAIKPS